MSHTITIKLNRPAKQFQAGASQGFSISGGVKYYDSKAKESKYTNYQAAIFSSNQGQIGYMTQVLIEGAIVEVTCREQSIESYESNGETRLYIKMLNCNIGYVNTDSAQATQPAQQAPEQFKTPPANYQPQQSNGYHQQPPAQNGQQVPNQATQQPQAQPQSQQQTAPPLDNFDDDIPF